MAGKRVRGSHCVNGNGAAKDTKVYRRPEEKEHAADVVKHGILRR